MNNPDLLNALHARGYLHQCTDAGLLAHKLASEKVIFYIGFDCTADSLHVGSLLPIMLIRALQQKGHQPIILLGSGTTMIGDPSGKDEARTMLTAEQIEQNKVGIAAIFAKYIDFSGSNAAILVDNRDWLLNINYLEFLRDYGRHFSVNKMLSFDSVRLRLERQQPLSFLEFNYMLLQAYDFLELYKRYGCVLQCGGSDQWGNIVGGIDLVRRINGAEVIGLTTPLLTTKTGAKMGKTANGAVWLNADKLSPYDYWQFWRNTDDENVIKFLQLFTDLSLAEIQKLSQLKGQELNEAKIILANEATRLCHGLESAQSAMSTASQTFKDGASGTELPELVLHANELQSGIPIFKLFIDIGFCQSGGEARRLIQGGGARLNDMTITLETYTISPADFHEGKVKISAGKKKYGIVRYQP